ncbi:DUF6923 family protein [Luteimonas sp. e5]
MNKRMVAAVLGAAAAVLALPVAAQTSLGSCPADAFITRGAGSTPTSLYTLDLATGAMTVQGPPDPDMAQVNGIGFRSQDGFIWGWNWGVNRLARVGQGGVTVLLSSFPANMPANASPDFYAADIQPSTGYYVGHDGGSWLYRLNVDTNAFVDRVNVGSALADTTDLAFSPIDGMIYSVNSTGGDLIRVNPATGASQVVAAGLLPTGETTGGGFGGLFFDSQGTLYAYKSGSGGAFGYVYRVFNPHTASPSYDRLAQTPTASRLDGARCPNAPPQGAPAIILNKLTHGQAGGPFDFTLSNTVHTSGSVSTTTAGTAAQVDGDTTRTGLQPFTVLNANLGQPVQITESTLPMGWRLSAMSCTLNGAPVGSADMANRRFTLPGSVIATGNSFVCTFENSRLEADLSVAKTATPTGPVALGAPIQYQLVVTNHGPDPVTGAVLTDTPDATSGLSCADSAPVSCTGTPASSCPAGPLTLGQLKAGLTLPTLGNGASATFGFTCQAQ